jgi:hypothetical protein
MYRSNEGDILIALNHEEVSPTLYLIKPSRKEIGIPNRSAFLVIPGVVYSRNVPPLSAPMGKAEVDPQLLIEGSKVEFTSVGG